MSDGAVRPGADALSFAVGVEEAGLRLDVAAARAAKRFEVEASRTRLKGLIEAGDICVNGHPVRDPNRKLDLGDEVSFILPAPVDAQPLGEALPLAVVFEDEHLIVIDKPAGLVVHPAPGHATGTLVNALIAHCGDSLSGIGGVRRPGIVHRLDKDTSGLLVVAKTDRAHHGLAALFADHGRTLSLVRSYRAIVWGAPARPAGTVETVLGRHPTDRLRMAVVDERHGREAITHWRVLESFGETSLVSCTLETGRTHQIRVHMAHIGHPVLGDPLYAKGFRTKAVRLSSPARDALDALGRQALHAAVLAFEHPVTGRSLAFESEPPADFATLMAGLRQHPATPA